MRSRRLISRASPATIFVAGLATTPFTRTRPDVHASFEIERDLKTRTAQSHLSTRTLLATATVCHLANGPRDQGQLIPCR